MSNSLADELMEDLEDDVDSGDEELQALIEEKTGQGPAELDDTAEAGNDEQKDADNYTADIVRAQGGIQPAQELNEEDVEAMQLGSVAEVKQIAKLLNSRNLKDTLDVRPWNLPGMSEC